MDNIFPGRTIQSVHDTESGNGLLVTTTDVNGVAAMHLVPKDTDNMDYANIIAAGIEIAPYVVEK